MTATMRSFCLGFLIIAYPVTPSDEKYYSAEGSLCCNCRMNKSSETQNSHQNQSPLESRISSVHSYGVITRSPRRLSNRRTQSGYYGSSERVHRPEKQSETNPTVIHGFAQPTRKPSVAWSVIVFPTEDLAPSSNGFGSQMSFNREKQRTAEVSGSSNQFLSDVTRPSEIRGHKSTANISPTTPEHSIDSTLSLAGANDPEILKDFPDHVPPPPQCGGENIILKSRVLGGKPVYPINRWPWLVVYGYKNRQESNSNILWLCSGALITEKITITTAHCVISTKLKLYVARFGEVDLNPSANDGANPVDIRVAETRRHPDFSDTLYTNDIALVILRESVIAKNLAFKPICLPFPLSIRERSFLDARPTAAGWGASDNLSLTTELRNTKLYSVQLPVLENKVCEQKYAKYGLKPGSSQLCVGGEKGKDTCVGDSGAPLMFPINGNYYIIGMVSYGSKTCGVEGMPGLYTRVTSFLTWIKDNLK